MRIACMKAAGPCSTSATISISIMLPVLLLMLLPTLMPRGRMRPMLITLPNPQMTIKARHPKNWLLIRIARLARIVRWLAIPGA